MKNIFLIAILLLAIILTGCEKGDGEADYGYAYIYMPQANVSGGLDNNYAVPAGGDENTYNFIIDTENQEVDIMLGALRSGKLPDEGFAVDIQARTDTTNTLIANGTIENGLLLPASVYSLPSSIEVPAGKYTKTFYLSVDASALMDEAYTDKKLVLTVGITNPTQYPLLQKYANTVVIIDVNSMRTYLN